MNWVYRGVFALGTLSVLRVRHMVHCICIVSGTGSCMCWVLSTWLDTCAGLEVAMDTEGMEHLILCILVVLGVWHLAHIVHIVYRVMT